MPPSLKKHRWILYPVLGFGFAIALFFLRQQQTISRSTTIPRLSQITFSEAGEEYPTWSPDTKEIAFCTEVNQLRKVFVRNLKTGHQEQLTKGPYDEIQPAWSPDNTQILFVRARQSQQRLEPRERFGVIEDGDVWAI